MASTRQLAPTKTDVGYAWVIVFATFFLQAIGDGVRFSYGLMFVEFLEQFQQGKGATAWIGSLMLGVFNLGGPVSGFIINKFGYRVGSMTGSVITALALILSSFAPSLGYLYFTYGVLHGFGSGLYFLAGTVVTGKYFKKKRALAIGITFCGGGIGTFVILPITRLLIDHYSWRGAMYILAGIVLNGCVFASLFRPLIELEGAQDNNRTEKLSNDEKNLNNRYDKLDVGRYLEDKENMLAMISNIAAGWLADLKCVHNLSLLGGCILTIGALTMIIAVVPRLETFFIYSALYGIFSAAMYGVQPIVLMEYFGEHSMASILGITMWVYGISGLIGTPAAGWLFDATGSYTASFLATGACFVLSGLINFLVLCTKPHIELRN